MVTTAASSLNPTKTVSDPSWCELESLVLHIGALNIGVGFVNILDRRCMPLWRLFAIYGGFFRFVGLIFASMTVAVF